LDLLERKNLYLHPGGGADMLRAPGKRLVTIPSDRFTRVAFEFYVLQLIWSVVDPPSPELRTILGAREEHVSFGQEEIEAARFGNAD
tara:strand:- start:684 stop:944 length:261 start_codon:yes stop_codon:yes gene_type:complete